jgi:phage gpG-like protein
VSSNAAREVAGRLRAIRAKAASEAPLAACRAAGQAGETAVKAMLSLSTHQAGSRTPSAPGQPPSLITGTLRRSFTRTPPRMAGAGNAYCLVGSKIIYAAVHEHGPVTITAIRFPQLGNPEAGFFGRSVVIPRRPYIAPAMKRLEDSGMLRRVTEEAWRSVIDL